MFDFLKKKIGGFIDNLTKNEGEEKAAAKAEAAIPETSTVEEEEIRAEEIYAEEMPAEEIPEEEISEEESRETREEAQAEEENIPEAIPEAISAKAREEIPEAASEAIREEARGQIISPSSEGAEPQTKKEPDARPKEAKPERARIEPEINRTKLEEIKREAAEILAKEAEAEPAKQAPHPAKSVSAPIETISSKEKKAKPIAPEIKLPEKKNHEPSIRETKTPESKTHVSKTHEIPAREIKKPETRAREDASEKIASPKKPEAPAFGKEKPTKEKERVKLGVFGAIKGLVTGEIEISESDVTALLDDLELELLEADVELTVANIIREELKAKLARAKVKRGALHEHVGSVIRETLVDILTNERDFDLVERAKRSEKPFKIVFLGINGAGKTTTIAKVARLLMDNGLRVNLAAADTFRAAAIEQLSHHGERLNVRVVKRDYGSDPTSVAFDAVNYAKAHSIDAVLIDTAGRQDTNISLINEMKKMDRVIKPDLKIYIGESISGNAIIEQISSFNREIGIDGVILTKLDCDPKGGTMLSISKATGIPILYLGVGQAYTDLERFDPQTIAERITS